MHVAGFENPRQHWKRRNIHRTGPRSTTQGEGPPRPAYAFTSRQWPFLFVLVGNWIFALALFLGAKLFWHWVPAEWSTPGDRIALVFKTEAELADALGLHSVLGLRQIESIADLLQLAEQFV
jgi:hypothetical protein